MFFCFQARDYQRVTLPWMRLLSMTFCFPSLPTRWVTCHLGTSLDTQKYGIGFVPTLRRKMGRWTFRETQPLSGIVAPEIPGWSWCSTILTHIVGLYQPSSIFAAQCYRALTTLKQIINYSLLIIMMTFGNHPCKPSWTNVNILRHGEFWTMDSIGEW